MNQASKPIYLSKTFWANAVMSLALILPKDLQPMALSPEVHALLFLVINTALRLISKDKVTLY